MLDSDSRAAAERMERELNGQHFWDGERRCAAAFATAVGGEGQLAWDTYLYYAAGTSCTDPTPAPAQWAHQLGAGGWADAGRFAWGADLIECLRSFGAMKRPTEPETSSS